MNTKRTMYVISDQAQHDPNSSHPARDKDSNFYHISLKYCRHLNKRKKKIRPAQQVKLTGRLGHPYFMWLQHNVAYGKRPALTRMDLHQPQDSRTRFSRTAAQIHHLQLRGPVLMGARGFNCLIIQPLTEGMDQKKAPFPLLQHPEGNVSPLEVPRGCI